MTMPANAALALEQVELGLLKLHEANYFSEDAWIKIDGLIHNGQYVFTRGPQNHLLDEPLISFGNPQAEAKPEVKLPAPANYSAFKENTDGVSKEDTSSPTSTDSAEPLESSSPSSMGTFSYGENAKSKPVEGKPLFDADEATTIVSYSEPAGQCPPSEQSTNSSSNNTTGNEKLPTGFTQEQIDEIKEFNAGLTKAGQKVRVVYSSTEEFDDTPSMNGEDIYSPGTSQAEQASEQTMLAPSWAHNVNTKTLASSKWASQEQETLNELYRTTHPSLMAKRPISHDLKTAVRSPKPTHVIPQPRVINHIAQQIQLVPGSFITARHNFPKKSKEQIEIEVGNEIKVIKHVSGIMHLGENQSSKLVGQFPDWIGVKSSEPKPQPSPRKEYAMPTPKMQQAPTKLRRVARAGNASISGSSIRNELDEIERTNAAEWDSDDPSTFDGPRHTSNTVRASTRRPEAEVQSLDRAQNRGEKAREQDMIKAVLQDEINKLFQQILNKQSQSQITAMKTIPSPPPPTEPTSWKESLQPVAPKTKVCWFWATPNKECRFTASECRDLHAHLPSKPGNDDMSLRDGRPTWGALADTLSSTPDPLGRTMTCWYWAKNPSSCTYTADSCKYLHEYATRGVAPRPLGGKQMWMRKWALEPADHDADERQWRDGGVEDEDVGEAQSSAYAARRYEGWENGTEAGWGREEEWEGEEQGGEAAEEKYQPPHIKAWQKMGEMMLEGL